MKRLLKDGFTLIELLVVIVIIALVLSIIIPPSPPPGRAYSAICQAHMSVLVKSWYLYQEENEGKLIQGYCPVETDNIEDWQDSWVLPPMEAKGDFVWTGSTRDNKVEGLIKGKLFEYIESEQVYHCPADKRRIKNHNGAYRSYSITALMNGKWDEGNEGTIYRKFSDIKAPSEKIVFMEEIPENDKNGNIIEYNKGSWQLDISGRKPNWKSPISSLHKKYLITGFADGHVEKYAIQDERTMKFAADPWAVKAGQDDNEDLVYFVEKTAQNNSK